MLPPAAAKPPPRGAQPAIRVFDARNAAQADALVALINGAYRSHDSWTTEADLVTGKRATLESLLCEARRFRIFVVADDADDARVLATIKVGLVASSVMGPLPATAGYIGLFAVRPDRQSRGLGSHLLTHAEQYLQSLGVRRIVMDVLGVRKELIQWYERRGYSPTGERVDAAPLFDSWGFELLQPSDFILLSKSLSN